MYSKTPSVSFTEEHQRNGKIASTLFSKEKKVKTLADYYESGMSLSQKRYSIPCTLYSRHRPEIKLLT